jgi:predicted AlkP superfamily phosphohydrolase/phosphomutase
MSVYSRIFLATCLVFTTCCSVSDKEQSGLNEHINYVTLEAASQKASLNTERICIIGIDGLTWDILNPMTQQGELPNFSKMIQTGSKGILDPADPILFSPRIWTSIATGKTPDEHGITFFFINPHQAMQSGETAGSDLRQCLAIWNIASFFKIRVHVSNWMISWPAEPVYGTVLSDYVEMNHGIWPEHLAPKIQHAFTFGFKQGDHFESINQRFYPWINENDAELSRGEMIKLENLRQHIYRDEFTLEQSLNLLSEEMSNLSMFYLRSVDVASHFYWKYSQLPPDDSRLDGLEKEIELFGHIVPEAYRWADQKLGKIVEAMPENTIFIILSDHGFTTYFNDLRGYNFAKLLGDLHCGHFFDGEGLKAVFTDTSDPIDPIRKIHVLDVMPPNFTEKTGMSRDQLIQNIIDNALSIKTLDGKQVLFLEPLENLKLLPGETAPDLAFRFNAVNLKSDDQLLLKDKMVSIETYIQFLDLSGNHNSEAVIIISGNKTNHGVTIENATSLDIVPTVLMLFDLPVADDMNGTPLFSAFKPDVLKDHPLTRIQSYESVIKREIVNVISPDRPNITEQLRTLGYIQ